MDSRELNILIIEDDPFITMVYQDHMEASKAAHFKWDVCTDLASGISALGSKSYDVLLLDLNLPDSDHENTVSRIPEISDHLPIVVMTSTNDELLALKTMNMGGQDYLIKNKLDPTLFIRSMLYAIERHELKRELKSAKKKSDDLLLNILPAEVVKEVKVNGFAEAKEFDQATIIFTDFKGFTAMSEKVSPKQLVKDLHECFSAFDRITSAYGIEKIKTIGDAYMAAGGLPTPNKTHATDIINAAFEMRDFVAEGKRRKIENGLPYFEIRIGINTGPVVAGIVGLKKFQYDIWGDTVNTASRMESSGEIGEVNISRTTYDLVKDNLNFHFESRGKLEVKGKGLMEMWRVHSNK
ncbi:response regulator [Cryomorphaceae bacterium 1068]|nr:response regulator [Cryomorphaceae bacterium 1068]